MTKEMENIIVKRALGYLLQCQEKGLIDMEEWITVDHVRQLYEHYPIPDPVVEEANTLLREAINLLNKQKCLTPGAMWTTKITDNTVDVKVTLLETIEHPEMLERQIHDVLERAIYESF